SISMPLSSSASINATPVSAFITLPCGHNSTCGNTITCGISNPFQIGYFAPTQGTRHALVHTRLGESHGGLIQARDGALDCMMVGSLQLGAQSVHTGADACLLALAQ